MDTEAPSLSILPEPSQAWKRGPITVTFVAFDCFSGVASVDYTVNGTPGTGRTLTLSDQGDYDIRAIARDLAGNVSPEARTFVRIDAAPPTAPVVTLPDAPPLRQHPRVQLVASTDSGSGVQGYLVSVSGPAPFSQQVGAGTQELTLPKLPNGAYTVQVTAFDGAQENPFFTGSPLKPPAWTT